LPEFVTEYRIKAFKPGTFIDFFVSSCSARLLMPDACSAARPEWVLDLSGEMGDGLVA